MQFSENFEIARTIITTLSVCVSLTLGLIALFSFRITRIPFGQIQKGIEKSFIKKSFSHLSVTNYEELLRNSKILYDAIQEYEIKLQQNWKFYWFPWTLRKAKRLKVTLTAAEKQLDSFIANYYLYVSVLERRDDFNKLQTELKKRKNNSAYIHKDKQFDDFRVEFYNDFKKLWKNFKAAAKKIEEA